MASRGVPIPSRVKYLSESELPHDYSATPGGTLYSTTPGGSRIIYERNVLMQMRNSPVASTPPRNLPNIPGVTKGDKEVPQKESPTVKTDQNSNLVKTPEQDLKKTPEVAEQDTEFEMEL